MVSGKSNEIYQYEAAGDVLVGWNFFQDDPEFASAVSTMDNGYFKCGAWWENTDTQAAYDAWKTMLLDEKWFVSFSVTCYGQQIAARIPADCLQ